MKLDEMQFTVIVIDGDFRTFDQLGQEALHYDGLTWEEACALARVSFAQGFQVVIMEFMDDAEDDREE